jgi:hypothetical protein
MHITALNTLFGWLPQSACRDYSPTYDSILFSCTLLHLHTLSLDQ